MYSYCLGPTFSQCAASFLSRRTVIVWGLHSLSVRHPSSLEVQLLSGAYILSVCSILKDTLLGTVSLPKQWTEKEQYVRAGLDNSWVAARNNFPRSLTQCPGCWSMAPCLWVACLPYLFDCGKNANGDSACGRLLGFLAWFHPAQQRTLYQYTWIPGLRA